MGLLLLAGLLVACQRGVDPSLFAPCAEKTDPRNSSMLVSVEDEAGEAIADALVQLDPYGQEALSNEVGRVCFGNLRVRDDPGCVLVSITVLKDGFGTFHSRNQRLAPGWGSSVDAELGPEPKTVERRLPEPGVCTTTP